MDKVTRYLHLLKKVLDAWISWRVEYPAPAEEESGPDTLEFNPTTGTYERSSKP